MPPERLQKLLSRRGLASRREAENWIRNGRVQVNGAPVRQLGVKVDPAEDRIEVDGAPLPPARRPITVLLNKPVGYVTTVRDRHAERTVMELVSGLKRRVYPVGRLDRESRGALLFTDDGDLAQLLLHPSRGVEKVYRVTAVGPFDTTALQRLAEGVELEDGVTAPARVWGVARERGRVTFHIALCEGRKRQVRRMVQTVGWRAVDLERKSFGGLTTRGLAEGQWRILSSREVAGLRRAARGESRRQRVRVRGDTAKRQRRRRR